MNSKRAEAPGSTSGSLQSAMSDAILAIAAERRIDRVLPQLVAHARELVDARYAAIGIPEEGGDGFSDFIYAGMSEELVAEIGPLPRRHGLLAAMLGDTAPYRTSDIRQDPRFRWWPDAHPRMASFLGVPIVAKGEVIGAFYLTDKEGAATFTSEDQATIEMLAAHAAVAIENARLHERSREAHVVEERNRLARELHDSVSQMLFSIALTSEAIAEGGDRDPEERGRQLANLRDLAREAHQEMRALIFELRPADLEADGLLATLEKHIDVLRRASGLRIELRNDGYEPQPTGVETEVFRVVQQALDNAVKHAAAERIDVRLSARADVLLATIADDGAGFNANDPRIRARRLGITSMEERAERLGGRLEIDSAPGRGTTIALRVPDDRAD